MSQLEHCHNTARHKGRVPAKSRMTSKGDDLRNKHAAGFPPVHMHGTNPQASLVPLLYNVLGYYAAYLTTEDHKQRWLMRRNGSAAGFFCSAHVTAGALLGCPARMVLRNTRITDGALPEHGTAKGEALLRSGKTKLRKHAE
eukprot:33246-Pelagomonas_calceolata.AAC.3